MKSDLSLLIKRKEKISVNYILEQVSKGEPLSKSMSLNKKALLKAISINPLVFNYVDESLKNNKKFMMEAFKANYEIFGYKLTEDKVYKKTLK